MVASHVVMARLSLTLLGGFSARLDDGLALRLPTRKAQALLAYLALPPGQAHPRDKLAALLWGGIREESARASLRQALFAIRRALGDAEATVLRQRADTLALEPAAVDVDAAAFERAVGDATPESLERAGTLYHGDLLAGLSVDEPPFDDWLLGERERLRELALEALAKLLTFQRKADKVDAAVGTALALLRLEPLQEPVHRTLMRLYGEQGRRGAALRQYQVCVDVLQRELRVEPEAETKQLYQEILRQRSSGPLAAVPPLATRRPAPLEVRATNERDSELIGRAAELERLHAALEAALVRAGRAITIIGDAGVGKSRLVAELIAHALRCGARVLLGRAYESEQILPFGPWVDALRLARVAEDAQVLERLGPALRAELARLLPEVGTATPPGGAALDIRQVFESVTQLIGQIAVAGPVVVVLEDLHWADEMTARLLEFVGRRLQGLPVALVATAREDELADAPILRRALEDLERDNAIARLRLAPLSEDDTRALVRSLARGGDASNLDRLSELAWAASEGNPFVVVETVRAHAEGTGLVQARGLALPERVREIVGCRLERLSERAQSVSAVAAVIGREFEFALLEHAAGLGEEEAAAAVEELVRRRVLHGVGERFDFIHDYVRAAAFSRILAPRRKLLHRRIADAIEAVYAADLGRHELALGQHFRDAEVWDRAARHLSNAADAARHRGANREAVVCFDAALQSLQHLPEDRPRAQQTIDALIQQESALMAVGEFRRSLDELRKAETLARQLGDRVRLGRVFGRVAYHLGSIGDVAGALENAEQARTIAIEYKDVRFHLGSNVQRARALYALGDYRGAMEAVRENDAVMQEADARSARVRNAFSSTWGVLALAEVGGFAEAIARGQEALRESPKEAGPHGEAWAHLGVGRLYLVQSDLERAIDVLERGLPLCEVGGDLEVYFSRMAASLGGAFALAGRLDEAVALLERADRHADSLGFAYGHTLAIATLAEAKLLSGDVAGAERDADRALALSRRHGQRGWEAWTLRLRGEIALQHARRDPKVAASHFDAAAALAEPRGMRPLLAHCRLGLARAYRAAAARARSDLADALAEYRALEMPYWRKRAEAELAELG